VISITQCNLFQACCHLYSNHLLAWSSTCISSSVCCIQTSHIQRMVKYRQTLLDLAHQPFLDLKDKSFNSDINKTIDYMSIHACNTTGCTFRSRATLECLNCKTSLTSSYRSRGYWDYFDCKQKMSSVSRTRQSRHRGLSWFSPHLCMLYAFWSIAGLPPPKIGTF
jgi:hypothetical protein